MRLLTGRRRRWVVVMAASVGIVCVGAGIAYAAIQESNGVIHACYKNATGDLRVIDTNAGGTCKPSETATAWNQQGPPGEQGPPGQSVDVVMAGATGTATAAGQEVIRQIPLAAGAYTLHATIVGLNSNTFPVVLGCTAYSSAEGTGIGFEGNTGSGTTTLLPDIAASSLDSWGEVVIQGAFQVNTETTIRLVCRLASEPGAPPITTTTNLILERVGSVTELN